MKGKNRKNISRSSEGFHGRARHSCDAVPLPDGHKQVEPYREQNVLIHKHELAGKTIKGYFRQKFTNPDGMDGCGDHG